VGINQQANQKTAYKINTNVTTWIKKLFSNKIIGIKRPKLKQNLLNPESYSQERTQPNHAKADLI
jgi:hypothetical protein